MHNSILIGSKRKSEIFENLLANNGNFNGHADNSLRAEWGKKDWKRIGIKLVI